MWHSKYIFKNISRPAQAGPNPRQIKSYFYIFKLCKNKVLGITPVKQTGRILNQSNSSLIYWLFSGFLDGIWTARGLISCLQNMYFIFTEEKKFNALNYCPHSFGFFILCFFLWALNNSLSALATSSNTFYFMSSFSTRRLPTLDVG